MISRMFVAALLAACLAACSSKDAATGTAAAAVSLATLPVTLEGQFSSEIGDGGEDEEGNADHFGELLVDGKEIQLLIPYKVVAAAGLGEVNENVRVRATIGRTVEGVSDLYEITAMTKL